MPFTRSLRAKSCRWIYEDMVLAIAMIQCLWLIGMHLGIASLPGLALGSNSSNAPGDGAKGICCSLEAITPWQDWAMGGEAGMRVP